MYLQHTNQLKPETAVLEGPALALNQLEETTEVTPLKNGTGPKSELLLLPLSRPKSCKSASQNSTTPLPQLSFSCWCDRQGMRDGMRPKKNHPTGGFLSGPPQPLLRSDSPPRSRTPETAPPPSPALLSTPSPPSTAHGRCRAWRGSCGAAARSCPQAS